MQTIGLHRSWFVWGLIDKKGGWFKVDLEGLEIALADETSL